MSMVLIDDDPIWAHHIDGMPLLVLGFDSEPGSIEALCVQPDGTFELFSLNVVRCDWRFDPEKKHWVDIALMTIYPELAQEDAQNSPKRPSRPKKVIPST